MYGEVGDLRLQHLCCVSTKRPTFRQNVSQIYGEFWTFLLWEHRVYSITTQSADYSLLSSMDIIYLLNLFNYSVMYKYFDRFLLFYKFPICDLLSPLSKLFTCEDLSFINRHLYTQLIENHKWATRCTEFMTHKFDQAWR